MSSSIDRRLLALEGMVPAEQQTALILLQTVGRDPEDIKGISWLGLPRKPDEPIDAYIGRAEDHLRRTRGNAGPALLIAEYEGDVD